MLQKIALIFLLFSCSFTALKAEPLPQELGSFANSWWYTPIDNFLYFNGKVNDEEGNTTQVGVFRTDGTENGTQQISQNILSYQDYIAIYKQKLGTKVFFVADQNNNGNNELYFADESTGQNTLLTKFDEVLFSQTIYIQKVYKNLLIFEGLTRDYGRELWISAGNPGDATLLKDICPGDCNSQTGEMVEFNGFLFFAANDGTNESELWISDGSSAGTMMFAEIYDDSALAPGDYVTGSGPGDFQVLGDKLIFSANDGIHGRELWVTDGTVENTELLKDCTPGTSEDGNPYDSTPDKFLHYGGKLYFVVSDETDGTLKWVIWETNGTEEGTQKVWTYDWTDGVFGSPLEMIGMDNKLFFPATHPEYGNEPFYIDLTETEKTARLLKDINPGIDEDGYKNNSYPEFFIFVSGASVGKTDRFYFRAFNEASGNEVWVSDGTTAGTVLLKDLNAGEVSSTLDEFYAIGSKLFFRVSNWYPYVVDLAVDEGDTPDGEDSTKPKINVRKPKKGDKVRTRFRIRGVAKDDKTVSKVECTYRGLDGWQEATLKTPKTDKKGWQKAVYICKVKLTKKVAKRLKKRGRVAVKLRVTDPAGNTKQIRRSFSLR